ncbi:uncharacterized protein [Euwallacea fornicatus]|uniref:uncharacterized protein n=1 Tax=Euwallacea fornicatus TaxID=995702 RepID=UPI00338FC8D2
MSLVADYGSESEDSDSEFSVQSQQLTVQNSIKTEIKKKSVIKLEPKDDESSEDENEAETKTVPLPVFKLPTPSFQTGASVDVSGSVFVNPFLVAENEKEAILERHVKMSNNKNVGIINGKKICWNYRKGRCRFGHKCKYAHDSDIQKSQQQLKAELEVAKAQSVVCQSDSLNSSFIPQKFSLEQTNPCENSVQKPEATKTKRKRPGLSEGLVPGKKVMKQYLNNKS